MFTSARYIAMDDDASELAPLVKALHGIGAPCIGIHYDPLSPPEASHFAGLRMLFTDLHLLKAVAAGVQNYDAIASVLDRCVPDNHGPYLLVLWTSHEEEREALADRLQSHLSPDKMPLAVLALGKERFRNGSSWNGPALADAIRTQIAAIPQLAAMLSWEQDVLAAANATLALVGDLVPSSERTLGEYAGALDRILSALAVSAAGRSNAEANPRGAVSSVLAPLLVDRIVNQGDRHGTSALWESAVTFPNDATALDNMQKGRMHRMLHFALPPAEPIQRTDWGAVIPLSPSQLLDDAMLARFGETAQEIRASEFKLKPERINDGRLVMLRAGAACDQAQSNSGPIPLLLGLLAPVSALRKDKRGQAVHECPEHVLLPEQAEPSMLLMHARFATTVVASDLVNWSEPVLRVREQLLMTILVHAATHAIRPGTLRF